MNVIDYTEKNDIELLDLALVNPNDYQYLMKRYEKKLLLYIQRIIYVGKEDAEDVLQEVFIKVYKNLNGFNRKYQFSSWIYRITHNEAISFIRSRRIEKENVHNNIEEQVFENLASEVDLESEFARNMDKEHVHRILDMLDDKYKDVLILKYIEEMDYNEIADVLKISSGTVGSLINRGKEKFKLLMKQNGINK
jgi:RNA polymerase sigma-70 factor (ECF subfamily)